MKPLFHIAIICLWSFPLFAQLKDERQVLRSFDLSTRVTSVDCSPSSQPPAEIPAGLRERAATVIQWKGRALVVSGLVNPNTPFCLKSSSQTAPIQFLGSFADIGLSIFELSEKWDGAIVNLDEKFKYSAAFTNSYLYVDPHNPEMVDFAKKFETPPYDHHYFTDQDGWISIDVTEENQSLSRTIYRTAGAAALGPNGFVGFFTDSTVTLYRGYTQTLRDFEIDLLKVIPLSMRRLAISWPQLVRRLDDNAKAPGSPNLTLAGRVQKPDLVTSYWQSTGKDFLETCFPASKKLNGSATPQKTKLRKSTDQAKIYLIQDSSVPNERLPENLFGDETFSVPSWNEPDISLLPFQTPPQGPIDLSTPLDRFIFTTPIVAESGGVDPFGIGGSEQKVVNCLISEAMPQSADHARILFAYRLVENSLEMREIDNILDLYRLKAKGFSVLTFRDRPKATHTSFRKIYELIHSLNEYPVDSIPVLKQTVRLLILMEAKPGFTNWRGPLDAQMAGLRAVTDYLGEITEIKSQKKMTRLKSIWKEILDELERLKNG